MNLHTRLWSTTLFVAALLVLGLAPSAKADAIYTFNNTTFDGFSWSFEVPSILTTTTTITSFLSTNVDPAGKLAFEGCTNIDSVTITDPQSTGLITTHFSGSGSCSNSIDLGDITTFGTFGTETIFLTIAPTSAPEPSSLLLLAGGLISFVGLRRKKIA